MYEVISVVPSPCAACYVCGGWCDATTLCCLLCMRWLVWCNQLVLHCRVCGGWFGAISICCPAMYAVVGVVPPPYDTLLCMTAVIVIISVLL